jgi:hypothetical protein
VLFKEIRSVPNSGGLMPPAATQATGFNFNAQRRISI